jgi:3-carboxy-cis,cis-muconate cycloisomerase
VFDRIFVPDEFREALSDRAWLQAMLDAERALAAAEARAGVIPPDAAEAIAAACEGERFDPAELGAEGRGAGNPVEPLVRALTAAVEGDAARYVHWGATSQDILDTAAMLVARNVLDLILGRVAQVAGECATLAEAHRETPMAARTLLQQAVPTTFGLKAAGWLVGQLEARRGLLRTRENLAAQLGGAAGTLAPLGDAGAEVARLFAQELRLQEPLVPWHTNRVRIAELGAALAITAGALAKIGLDVALMAQTEVGEVAEAEGGVSSTMPQKRNPVGSALAIACARQVQGHTSVLIAALPQEHERAVGGWHSEWPALSGALAYTGGAAEAARRALDGLEVDAERMRANLASAVMAEQAAFALAEQVGRREAYERIAREGVSDDVDPASYLGSAETFVDAALVFYRSELE